ncbi:MAG: hypothetical protein WBQ21_10260 [Solirubrobacteraceae bacterium]
MSRSLEDVRLAALMVDGIELKGHCAIVALGVSTEGVKIPLGLWGGFTEKRQLRRTSSPTWSTVTLMSSRRPRRPGGF